MKRDLIKRLLEQGFTRKSHGAKAFWKAYRAEYQRLPEVKARLNARRRLQSEATLVRKYARAKERFLEYRTRYYSLTKAQLAVAQELVKGKNIDSIALATGKSYTGVQAHLRVIYAKSRTCGANDFLAKWARGHLPAKIQRQLPRAHVCASQLLPLGAA